MRTGTHILMHKLDSRVGREIPQTKASKYWEQLQLCSTFSVKRTFLPHNSPAVQVLGLCIAISQLALSKFSVLSGRCGELRQLQELGEGKKDLLQADHSSG